MTIPSWLLLFMWLFVVFIKVMIPSSLERSNEYNWQLTSFGENAETITINRVMFYEYVEGNRFLDNAFFPNQEDLIYDLENKEQIKTFFVALADHEIPASMCYPRVGKNYFRLLALDHTNMKEGSLTFHFCKIKGKNFAIFEVDDDNIHSDYFASSEMADFLESIGIEP